MPCVTPLKPGSAWLPEQRKLRGHENNGGHNAASAELATQCELPAARRLHVSVMSRAAAADSRQLAA